jgi:hypothetical protein
VSPSSLEASAAEPSGRQLHANHSPQIQTIDVACGKEKMTVRVTFDQDFNGVIYAKVSANIASIHLSRGSLYIQNKL